jgi:iron complex transport system substrate-binding protein
LFHPDLFEDLNPEAVHQEYLDRFQRIDYDLNEHGIFLYPPIEVNGDLAGVPDRYKGQIDIPDPYMG